MGLLCGRHVGGYRGASLLESDFRSRWRKTQGCIQKEKMRINIGELSRQRFPAWKLALWESNSGPGWGEDRPRRRLCLLCWLAEGARGGEELGEAGVLLRLHPRPRRRWLVYVSWQFSGRSFCSSCSGSLMLECSRQIPALRPFGSSFCLDAGPQDAHVVNTLSCLQPLLRCPPLMRPPHPPYLT